VLLPSLPRSLYHECNFPFLDSNNGLARALLPHYVLTGSSLFLSFENLLWSVWRFNIFSFSTRLCRPSPSLSSYPVLYKCGPSLRYKECIVLPLPPLSFFWQNDPFPLPPSLTNLSHLVHCFCTVTDGGTCYFRDCFFPASLFLVPHGS